MSHNKPLVWSSSFFLLPLALAFYFQVWPSAVILIALIVVSLAYHKSKEKKFFSIDALLARILIIFNLLICYLGNFAMPYFAVVLILIVLALYFYFYKQRDDYPLGHGFWHLFSALITVFSILTFIY